MSDSSSPSEILSDEPLFDAGWLKLRKAQARIRGRIRSWIYCTRREQAGGSMQQADAVVIVPFLRKGDETWLILIREYRIPLAQYQLAFPAGLLEAGEALRPAAERELLEECGCRIVQVLEESPVLSSSAGMSDERFQYLFVEAEQVQEAALEESEDLEMLQVRHAELAERMQSGEGICGRVWPVCRQLLSEKAFPDLNA